MDVSVRSASMPSVGGSDRMARRSGSDSTRAGARRLRLQTAKLVARRQPSVPQQIADFLERHAALGIRQVVNVVPVIRQNAALAVEIADRRLAGDNVLETGFGLRVARRG